MLLDDCSIFKASGQCATDNIDECRKCRFNQCIGDLVSTFENDIDKAEEKMLVKVEQSIADFIKQERAK